MTRVTKKRITLSQTVSLTDIQYMQYVSLSSYYEKKPKICGYFLLGNPAPPPVCFRAGTTIIFLRLKLMWEKYRRQDILGSLCHFTAWRSTGGYWGGGQAATHGEGHPSEATFHSLAEKKKGKNHTAAFPQIRREGKNVGN
jgi:hypothetical protein